jgi:hypothetical protein
LSDVTSTEVKDKLSWRESINIDQGPFEKSGGWEKVLVAESGLA